VGSLSDYKLSDHKPIKPGLTKLLKSDPVFSLFENKKELGAFARIKRDGDFPAMIGAILGQQVSVAAARAMWQKLLLACKGDVTPRKFLKLTDEDLRACGFSRQKVIYARGLAEAILEKTFLPENLLEMEDEEVIAEITKLKGFGVWSAHMYLIFSLGRPDVWPVGDLGVVIGAQYYLKKKDRPDLKLMEKLGGRFEGHRTAAALLLWDLKAVREAEAKLKKIKA
jgi:DNA-3-methyladenine glycosylase II